MTPMELPYAHYGMLASIYAFPEEGYTARLLDCQKALDRYLPEAGALLDPFTGQMSSMTLTEQQELFTRSFEVQSVTTLDLGYVLFGDDYKRGELLVNLNRECREAGVECGVELADHLYNVLRLLPELKDPVLQRDLAERIIWHALKRMICSFGPELVAEQDAFYKKKYKTILERPIGHFLVYSHALQALYVLLEKDFQLEDRPLAEQQSDFLKNLQAEVALEDAGS